jgi:hypothetical protein
MSLYNTLIVYHPPLGSFVIMQPNLYFIDFGSLPESVSIFPCFLEGSFMKEWKAIKIGQSSGGRPEDSIKLPLRSTN